MTNRDLEAAFSAASDRLAAASKNKVRKASHEAEYGQAYQALVRAGVRPQLSKAAHRRYQFVPRNALG